MQEWEECVECLWPDMIYIPQVNDDSSGQRTHHEPQSQKNKRVIFSRCTVCCSKLLYATVTLELHCSLFISGVLTDVWFSKRDVKLYMNV